MIYMDVVKDIVILEEDVKDVNEKLLGGVSNVYEDTRINKELFQLAHAYA